MGFVLSGMNLGALIAPSVAGAVYDRAGYYAVWIICLAIIAVDFVLRLAMVEKRTAKRWSATSEVNGSNYDRAFEGTSLIQPEESNDHASPEGSPKGRGRLDSSTVTDRPETYRQVPERAEVDDSALSPKTPPESWLWRHFPTLMILLSSPRIWAAVYGCFTHTALISSFDAVLPLFVGRTFSYRSTGAGMILLAITIPSVFGAIIGALSDRYGPRTISLCGFALTPPCLALMGLVTDDSIGHQATLIVLLVAIGLNSEYLVRFQADRLTFF